MRHVNEIQRDLDKTKINIPEIVLIRATFLYFFFNVIAFNCINYFELSNMHI